MFLLFRFVFLTMIVACAWGKGAIISVFHDGGVGAGGTFLDRYPAKVKVNGRYVKAFPAAVHSSLVSSYKYKVLRVRHKSGTGYVHIVDECASGSCGSNHRKAKRSGRVLLDIHASAMRQLKLSYTLNNGEFQVVGKAPLKNVQSSVVSSDAKRGYLPNKWQ